jgi:hypothetical protein
MISEHLKDDPAQPLIKLSTRDPSFVFLPMILNSKSKFTGRKKGLRGRNRPGRVSIFSSDRAMHGPDPKNRCRRLVIKGKKLDYR